MSLKTTYNIVIIMFTLIFKFLLSYERLKTNF